MFSFLSDFVRLHILRFITLKEEKTGISFLEKMEKLVDKAIKINVQVSRKVHLKTGAAVVLIVISQYICVFLDMLGSF